jgi:hypothetical protein
VEPAASSFVACPFEIRDPLRRPSSHWRSHNTEHAHDGKNLSRMARRVFGCAPAAMKYGDTAE